MDMLRIGAFLAELRREQGLTQSQLGEELGVTNKTVSRWETGTYLPPAEMLQLLSERYGVTINELLSGKRLSEGEYREKAEENFRSALEVSSFTVQERLHFYKKKWLRDNRFTIGCCVLSLIVLIWSLIARHIEASLIPTVAALLALVYYIVLHNRMMAYAEDHVFIQSPRQELRDPPDDSGRV